MRLQQPTHDQICMLSSASPGTMICTAAALRRMMHLGDVFATAWIMRRNVGASAKETRSRIAREAEGVAVGTGSGAAAEMRQREMLRAAIEQRC